MTESAPSLHLAESRERRFLRLPLRVDVRIPGDERPGGGTDYAINLSEGGLCLQTSQPRHTGERLTLRFHLGADGPALSVDARVVWSIAEEDRAPGMRYSEMGLRFLGLDEASRQAICHFIQDVSRVWADE